METTATTTKEKTEKTDLEKFVELHKSFGIECQVTGDSRIIFVTRKDSYFYEKIYTFVGGNNNCYTVIEFDSHGKFVKYNLNYD